MKKIILFLATFIILIPSVSANARLKEIKVDDNQVDLSTLFLKTNTETINVTATPEESTTKILSGLGSHTLKEGSNLIEIKTQDNAGETLTYLLTIEKRSSNTNLKSFEITPKEEEQKITKVSEYEFTVDYEVSIVSLTAHAEDPKAIISYFEDYPLKEGENIISIKITATDGTQKSHEIKITRAENPNPTEPDKPIEPEKEETKTADYLLIAGISIIVIFVVVRLTKKRGV